MESSMLMLPRGEVLPLLTTPMASAHRADRLGAVRTRRSHTYPLAFAPACSPSKNAASLVPGHSLQAKY